MLYGANNNHGISSKEVVLKSLGMRKIIDYKTNEIGSEFWDIPSSSSSNNLFVENTQWYVSGRAALCSVLKELKPNKVALPSYCCDSMIIPLLESNIEYSFYPVTVNEDGLSQKLDIADCDAVVVMDYFGFHRNLEIPSGVTAIRDLTQSLFCKRYDDADYYFGSLRKWAGFYTGGYAWNKDGTLPSPTTASDSYIELRKKAMREKADYISGNSESKGYLDTFSKTEEMLDSCLDSKSCDDDISAAKHLDIEFIRRKRRENAGILISELKDYCLFKELKDDDVPLFVPIVFVKEKRDALRRYLISKEIYCPIHWPITDMHQVDGEKRKIYDSELSLVCDQRYVTDDMMRIVEEVKGFLK